MNVAPWLDFAGNVVREGDTIQHPSGERGKVVFLPAGTVASDKWRVDYGTGDLSRLCLQVGDRGRAVVVSWPPADTHAPAAAAPAAP